VPAYGDGGTADIGMSSFSQAITSGYKFIYICVDNQAYMNTGIQWSSTTPPGAVTTTTPMPETLKENTRKDLFKIAVAHNIPYAATASPAYPLDYAAKVRKAASVDGPSFIHVLTPCPPGWGFPTERSIEIGCLAVECGMWYLCEYQDGQVRFTHQPKARKPISEYLATQSRFNRMKPEDIACLQSIVDERMAELEANAKNTG
jgi:pyruvate ferredoxin oxidoreductase beta subunit